ncbi:hypothetical protein KUCAC02_004591, partial [Chaenocephalus aceratus]
AALLNSELFTTSLLGSIRPGTLTFIRRKLQGVSGGGNKHRGERASCPQS